MKNILKQSDKNELLFRVTSIQPDSIRLWGKMTANEMICHVSDQMKMALGVIETRYYGSFVHEKILKNLVLLGMPTPKAKVKTVKELDQNRDGTKPTDFETDKAGLIELISGFDSAFKDDIKYRHTVFGWMNKRQWGRLVYLHMDHHLRQFSQ